MSTLRQKLQVKMQNTSASENAAGIVMKFAVQKARITFDFYRSHFEFGASAQRGMTLIETLVAITILAVAIVAPMSLTMQSLRAAYYARDSVIASNLAQEAIESVRSVRDGNILRIALNLPDGSCGATGLLCGIPIDTDFMIDTRDNEMTRCDLDGSAVCSPLQTDLNQTLYGYQPGWVDTPFVRTVRAEYIDGDLDQIRITVTVERTGGTTFPPVVITENMYRWIEDGSGA